jgi:hypothetical protein
MKAASCRYVIMCGERGHKNHAVIAPFCCVGQWSTDSRLEQFARQEWSKAEHCQSRYSRDARSIDAVNEMLRYEGQKVNIELHSTMLMGPVNWVPDNLLGGSLLGREPQMEFVDRLDRASHWYFRTNNGEHVATPAEVETAD